MNLLFSTTALVSLVLLAWPLASAGQTVQNGQHVPSPAPFKSAFENYNAYTDGKAMNWQSANAGVASVGGWRAYAAQVQQGQDSKNQPMPPNQATDPTADKAANKAAPIKP